VDRVHRLGSVDPQLRDPLAYLVLDFVRHGRLRRRNFSAILAASGLVGAVISPHRLLAQLPQSQKK
jgi:hypothetical protein